MKSVRWTRFTWNLSKLPLPPPPLPAHYLIRPAERGEEGVVRHVIMSAFALDMDWNDMLASLRQRFDSVIDPKEFGEKNGHCLVLTHGNRVIGAAVMDLDANAENHLISGPCVLSEYRNRGFGSALLYQSLVLLRDNGGTMAHGVTKENVPAAKFLYPKFESVKAPHDFELAMVNS